MNVFRSDQVSGILAETAAEKTTAEVPARPFVKNKVRLLQRASDAEAVSLN